MALTSHWLILSQMTNFRLFKTEIVYRQQFQIWWNWQKVLRKDRKHSWKRRYWSLQAISYFSTVFWKDLYCRHIKIRNGLTLCFGKSFQHVQIENIHRQKIKFSYSQNLFPTSFTSYWLTFSKMTNFRLPNWKSLQTTSSNLMKWQKVLQTCRKHCGKRRNCSIWAISPFPTVFSKDLYT